MKRKLVESNKKNKYYDGSLDKENHNTLTAWIREDIQKNDRVDVDDKYGHFRWNRNDSNDNVKYISKSGGSGDGKGFSFYFARYGYSDKALYRDESLSTSQNPNYSGCLVKIDLEFLIKEYLGGSISNSMRKRLKPDDAVLLLTDELKIEENSEEVIEIISATYSLKDEHLLQYAENSHRVMQKMLSDLSRKDMLNGKEENNIEISKKLKNSLERSDKKLNRMIEQITVNTIINNIKSGTKLFKELLQLSDDEIDEIEENQEKQNTVEKTQSSPTLDKFIDQTFNGEDNEA